MSIIQPDALKVEIDERVPDLLAMRRDLHEHPELAFEEVRTAGIVADRLRALHMEVQTNVAQTGVVGLLRGGKAGPVAKTLALRADMDALPIQELNEVEYRSRVDGKMHACGHDGHTSILLTVADLLARRRADLAGNVKFIFQPAEERINGAALMVKQGVMQDVDGVLGLHLISHFPFGYVGVRAGSMFASADSVEFTVHGSGGHAAMPHDTVDPIVLSAYLITALQTLVSRETSPFNPAVFTVASIHAGSAANIIPEQVEMLGTMRAFIPEQRSYLARRVHEIAHGVTQAMGGSCDVRIVDGCPPCVNEVSMTNLVYRAAQAAIGPEYVISDESVLTTGADDMAYFLAEVPGCYFIVGVNNPAKDSTYPHHHPRFAIDEDALAIGVEVLTRAALDFFE